MPFSALVATNGSERQGEGAPLYGNFRLLKCLVSPPPGTPLGIEHLGLEVGVAWGSDLASQQESMQIHSTSDSMLKTLMIRLVVLLTQPSGSIFIKFSVCPLIRLKQL